LDDVELVNSEVMRPQVEVWVHQRPSWQHEVQGASQDNSS
jgi:hypothetical protein